MGDAAYKHRPVRPARDYFSLKMVLAMAALAVFCAALFGLICIEYGIHPIIGAISGVPVVIPVAGTLFWLQKREYARVDRENQRVGWSYQEAETARRIAEMKAGRP